MTTKVPGRMIADGAIADADTNFTAGNYPRVAVDGSFEERTPTQVAGDLGVSAAADPTITALAAQNWAANSVAIGTGVDTVAQVTFGANTFPARASSGSLVAKTATDSAITAMSFVVSGTYTPTITNTVNCDSVVPHVSQWMRVNDVVTVSGYVDVDPTTAAGTFTAFQISLPIASAITALEQVAGTACGNSLVEPGLILASVANDTATCNFAAASAAAHAMSYQFTYRVL